MKKITLFIMSMFFVLGTSMAQDDATPTSFELVSVKPDSSKLVTSVTQVMFEFNKEVAVTLPEGGIEVKNVATQEGLKLTRVFENPWMPKTNVTLQFEQKVVEGKDGKEELQDQYLDTPGKYTFTVPAGCIKSLDGEEFPETSFSFTIAATFPVDKYTPTETDKFDQIQLTFSQEIESVVLPDYGLSVVDYYWTSVANVKGSVISDDKKTVTLELDNTIATPGEYYLSLPVGTFVSKDGINAYTDLTFNVVDYTPSFSTNFNDGDQVEELKNLIITFNNVKEVKLVEGVNAIAYLPGGGESVGTATLADNQITVTFEQEFTEQGEYSFYIPAGMFTMDGVANEERILNVTLFSFTVTPLEVMSVTPIEGDVDQLDKIIIRFNQAITLSYDENWQWISGEIILKSDGKDIPLTYNSMNWGTSDELEYLVNAEWVNNDYKVTPITEAGTYTLDISQIVVDHGAEEGIDEWGYPATVWHSKAKSCEGTYTWKVTGEAGIDDLKVTEGKQVIYDLLGRRVQNLNNAGIYIVNGKKVVIK